MTDAISLIRACREAEPGDYLPFLIAADFFDASDEGDDALLARAFRWMAAQQKHPARVEVPVDPRYVSQQDRDHGIVPSGIFWCWYPSSYLTGGPEHAQLSGKLSRVASARYRSWLAAVFALAAALSPDCV